MNATGLNNNNDIVGISTTSAGAFADISTSTINGTKYDINREEGTLRLGFSNLQNNTTNQNSFSVVTETSSIIYGVDGNLPNTSTKYLAPGIITLANLPTAPFYIPITQGTSIFTAISTFTVPLAINTSITLNIYKNLIVNPVYTITLGPGQTTITQTNVSADFIAGDTFYANLVSVGNIPNGTYAGIIKFY